MESKMQHNSLSQVEPSPFVKTLIKEMEISRIETPDDLIQLRKCMTKVLHEEPYTEEVALKEEDIRWKRSGSQILEDGFVYKSKSCTDIVIAFMTLAIAAGIEDMSFVRIYDPATTMIHSLAEFKLNEGWYYYDVSYSKAVPTKGQIEAGKPVILDGEVTSFILWKKGRDSWSLGFDSIEAGAEEVEKKKNDSVSSS